MRDGFATTSGVVVEARGEVYRPGPGVRCRPSEALTGEPRQGSRGRQIYGGLVLNSREISLELGERHVPG